MLREHTFFSNLSLLNIFINKKKWIAYFTNKYSGLKIQCPYLKYSIYLGMTHECNKTDGFGLVLCLTTKKLKYYSK